MTDIEIAKKLIDNDALFRNIHVIEQCFNILPDKNHYGISIRYQDLFELREEFLNELLDSVVDWVYSSSKYDELRQKALSKGKTEAGANSEVRRKAVQKFRKSQNPDEILIQGQFGELMLFHCLQRFMKAVPLLRKMKITTSSGHERFGADAIHYKKENGKNVIILGEAKTYASSFNKAFYNALDSILDTYNKHRTELNLYVHEDFLEDDLNQIAESYLSCTLPNVEVHLVCIIIYEEKKKLIIDSEDSIHNQIQNLIINKFDRIDNSLIDITGNPILSRITYIAFPVWKLNELMKEFQNQL